MTSKTKCNKVKNPCKICLAGVSNKTGLECQGACRRWVHFKCLNYTPGKIKDIKTGVIKVTCPCPDCKTTIAREYRTDDPFSCSNVQCPANLPPRCENDACPSNGKMCQTSGNCLPPLTACAKKSCKKHSFPQVPKQKQCAQTFPCPTSPSPPIPKFTCNSSTPNPACPTSSSSEGFPRSAPACPSSDNLGYAGDTQRGVMMPSASIVEQMCNTVGQLTNQINDLMCKMKQVVKEKGPGGGGCRPKHKAMCEKTGPKTACPKPCFCPQNPHR